MTSLSLSRSILVVTYALVHFLQSNNTETKVSYSSEIGLDNLSSNVQRCFYVELPAASGDFGNASGQTSALILTLCLTWNYVELHAASLQFAIWEQSVSGWPHCVRSLTTHILHFLSFANWRARCWTTDQRPHLFCCQIGDHTFFVR